MKIYMHKNNIGRIRFPCEILGTEQTIIFDTGSPNTMITIKLAKDLGLKAVSRKQYSVNIGGTVVKSVVTVLPEITIGSITIKDVRVLAGLSSPNWHDTILLGLNVLNYFRYAVDRSIGGGFVDLDISDRKAPAGATREKFNHLILSKTEKGVRKSIFDITPDPLISSELSIEDALLATGV